VALGRTVGDWARVRTILIGILASAFVPLAVAANQLSGGGGLLTFEGFSRISGTFLHPNPFGTYLFLILVLIASLFPHVSRGRRWLLLAPLAIGCAGVLIVTYSRGAWVAAVVGLLVVGFLQSRRLLVTIGIAVVTVLVAVPSVGVRLSDLSESRAASGATGNSLAWRLQYWDEVIALQDNPFLGIGLREVELNQEAEKAPHNDFLRVYVETGVLGLVAYCWLLVALLVQAHGALRRAPPGAPRGLAVAFMATTVGLIVLSIVANVVSQLVILWYFAAIVVLALAASRLPRDATAAAA
jgi:O-antigen ligase